MRHHLAQINIALMKFPDDDPRMAGFMDGLDKINAVADASPGFVWRLQTDDGNATSIRVFDDDMLLVNLSVWEDVERFKAFTYKSDHAPFLRRRAEWFKKMDAPHLAMWWVPVGHIPSTDQAKEKLEALEANGPGPDVFTFRSLQPPPR